MPILQLQNPDYDFSNDTTVCNIVAHDYGAITVLGQATCVGTDITTVYASAYSTEGQVMIPGYIAVSKAALQCRVSVAWHNAFDTSVHTETMRDAFDAETVIVVLRC